MFYARTARLAIQARKHGFDCTYSWAIYQMYLGRLTSRWANDPRLF